MSDPVFNIYSFLPSHYKTAEGTFLHALLKAINNSAKKQEDLVESCIDQLFIPTATGKYLIQLGEEQGFVMPTNSGLDIRSYRALIPVMVADPKQVRNSIDELINAFYGTERTRPYVTASVAEPYSLLHGDNLIVDVLGNKIDLSILEGQVSDLTNVTAAELASVLNSSQDFYTASVYNDKALGLNYLRISAKAHGAGATIRIAGGTLQNVLKFSKLAPTTAVAGTTWNLTKSSAYDDSLKFEWNGIGTNPSVFAASKGDVVTIRGLVDGVHPYSKLNGSYELIDVGYDYFVVRNAAYGPVSSSVLQPNSNSFVFTKSDITTIFDQTEFALTTEVDSNTISVTVPAIPPLARRFLSGSAHLQGTILDVVDFDRTSLKVDLPGGIDKPVGFNRFLLRNRMLRMNARRPYYGTITVDSSITQPTYVVDSADEKLAVLPYTTPIAIGTNPIEGKLGSHEYIVTFPFKHGLERGWGFTLAGCTGLGNVTAAMLNQEHAVYHVKNDKQVIIRLKDSSGNFLNFVGPTFAVTSIDQYPIPQTDESDFFLQFPSLVAMDASGVEVGNSVALNVGTGTVLVGHIAIQLYYKTFLVVGRDDINFRFKIKTGVGTGPNGTIISAPTLVRSGKFGGTPTYKLDKTSSLNVERVMTGLEAVFLNHTPSSNKAYVGSFMYDPDGIKSSLTVSKQVVKLTSAVFKGDNVPTLSVDTTVDASGEPLPQTGEIVIDYGTDEVEGPIRFFAVISNPGSSQILIDQAYKFKKRHDVGSQVQVIRKASPYVPTTNGSDYPVYLTGPAQARNTMFHLIELLVAAGIFVEKNVVLPTLRYADESIPPFE